MHILPKSSEDIPKKFCECGFRARDCVMYESRCLTHAVVVSHRFAFVEFESEEAASAAIEQHNDEEVDGRELHVSHAGAPSKSTPHKPQQKQRLYLFRS